SNKRARCAMNALERNEAVEIERHHGIDGAGREPGAVGPGAPQGGIGQARPMGCPTLPLRRDEAAARDPYFATHETGRMSGLPGIGTDLPTLSARHGDL